MLAADRTVELGSRSRRSAITTRQTLEKALPDHWSHGNPIDIIGDAPPERYRLALDACLADPEVDGVLCILAPVVFGDPVATAEQVIAATKDSRKPVLACWMGGKRVAEAQELLLSEHDVPHFDSPEVAIDAFSFLATHQRNQKLLMQSPGPLSQEDAPDVEGARLIIEGVMAEGRKTLGTVEAKAILSAFRIPTMQAVLTRTPNEALMAAQALGFPVVMKINSPDLEHKSDVDGVRLNIDDAQSVRRTFTEIVERAKRLRPDARMEGITVEHMASTRAARELMIGVTRDRIFGPGHQFRCRRHQGRGPRGSRARSAAAQRLHHPDHDRPHPDRASHGCLSAHAADESRGLGEDSSAGLRDGLRAAGDHLDGHQPADRKRQGCHRRGCAHQGRLSSASADDLRPHGDPPLSEPSHRARPAAGRQRIW